MFSVPEAAWMCMLVWCYLWLMFTDKKPLTGAGNDAQGMVWVTWTKGKSVECNGLWHFNTLKAWAVTPSLIRMSCVYQKQICIICTVLLKHDVMKNKAHISYFVITVQLSICEVSRFLNNNMKCLKVILTNCVVLCSNILFNISYFLCLQDFFSPN